MAQANLSPDIEELHWQMGLLQNLDAGLVVVDRQYRVQLWNSFMENHSGIAAGEVLEADLFAHFSDLRQEWFTRKLEAVFLLKTPSYINWEQRPRLFAFKSHRPITGLSPQMYQNVSLIPLTSPSGEVNHVGILIFDVTDVALSTQQLQQANEQLEELSRKDRLTGLFNRGYWQECLESEYLRFMRSQRPSTLIILDIDHFKRVNDTYGHPAGDDVICRLAEVLQQHARRTDIVGRYGGEEFGVILLDTDARQAEVFAERLRRAVELELVSHAGHEISFTVSLGIAELDTEMNDAEVWLSQADRALYQSKETGRNRYTVFGG